MSLSSELLRKIKSVCSGAEFNGVEAKLRVGSLSARVRVARESIDRFIVTTAEDLGFPLGSKGLLRTTGRLSEVQVSDLRPVAGAPSRGNPQSQDPSCTFNIELRRIRDLPLPTDDANLWRMLWRRLTRPCSLSAAAVVVLAGACGALAVLMIAARWNATEPARVPPLSPRAILATPPESAALAAEPASSESAPTDAATRELRRQVNRLPGATCFALPELIEDLQLTPRQQQQFQQMMTIMNKTLQGIEELRSTETAQQYELRRQRILRAARRDALDILSPAQQARWDAITRAGP